MGILGRYLDLLPPDARNRILRAEHWTTELRVDNHNRDILGHAEDWRPRARSSIPVVHAPEVFSLRSEAGDELWTTESRIASTFTRLVRRRGMNPTLTLIRARLGGNRACEPATIRRGHLSLLR